MAPLERLRAGSRTLTVIPADRLGIESACREGLRGLARPNAAAARTIASHA
jgi:hypothetical protein